MEPLESLRGGKTCVNLSAHARWRVSGGDAERFLNGQLTQKIEGLGDGLGLHSAVCTAKGKLDGDLHVSKIDGDFLLDWTPRLGDTLKDRLEKYVVTDDVTFSPIREKLFFIAGDQLPTCHLGSREVRTARHGLKGFDLWLPEGAIPPVLVANAETWEEQRVLSGTPLAHVDYTGEHLAAEIFDEGTTLHYRKGCYVGQEVLNRIRTIGKVNRRLHRLQGRPEFSGTLPLSLVADGQEVGTLTSVMKAGPGQGFVGLAVIKTAAAAIPLTDSLGNVWSAARA